MSHAVLDLFAGHGFGVALRRLGVPEYAVEIWDRARETRALNRLSDCVYTDAWDVEAAADLVFDTLTGGPPCQLFSAAGSGKARKFVADLLAAIEDGTYRSVDGLRALLKRLDPEHEDDRIVLVLLPLLYIWRYRPTFVLLEQVQAVLPIWHGYARAMEEMGYSVAVQVVKTEQYGVPQTRRRAVLLARRDGHRATFPAPTHSRYYEREPERMDPEVAPYVTMRDALGPVWAVDRPSPTVTGGGLPLEDRKSSGRAGAVPSALRSNYGTGGNPKARGVRTVNQPAPAITGKADRMTWSMS